MMAILLVRCCIGLKELHANNILTTLVGIHLVSLEMLFLSFFFFLGGGGGGGIFIVIYL